jgi:hypothetical protein
VPLGCRQTASIETGYAPLRPESATFRSHLARLQRTSNAGRPDDGETAGRARPNRMDRLPAHPSRRVFSVLRLGQKVLRPGVQTLDCLLRFDVLHKNQIDVVARIPMWLPLGKGERPRASRRGKYLKEWVEANGTPPARRDRLSPRVFAHRIARVEVGDTEKGPVPYSVVKEILRWDTGKSGHSVSKSHSQGRQREGTGDE